MKVHTKKSTKTKKFIILSVIAALLLVGSVSAYFIAQQSNKPDVPQANNQNKTVSPTQQTDNTVTPQGDAPQTSPEKGTNTTPQKIDIVPLISNYGLRNSATLSVSGIITGIVEQGGKCTITLSWGGGSKTTTVDTTTGPNSTTCVEAQFATSSLPETSMITARLSYVSDKYSGTSKNNPTFTLKDLRGE